MDESDDDVNPWEIGLPEPKTASELLSQDREHLERLAHYLSLANERRLKTALPEEAAVTGFE